MQFFVVSTFYGVMDWLQNHYIWGNITFWDFALGVFCIDGILGAFRIGRYLYDVRESLRE